MPEAPALLPPAPPPAPPTGQCSPALDADAPNLCEGTTTNGSDTAERSTALWLSPPLGSMWPSRLCSVTRHFAMNLNEPRAPRSACIASLVPVLCMMTDYGRCGVHIVQPLRSPVGCVCPQQSKRFKFARAWQPLTRSLTPHPPRTTPVWDPSTLARMQFEGEVIVLAGLLACLLASGRVFPMASRGSATWVGSNLWAFQW